MREIQHNEHEEIAAFARFLCSPDVCKSGSFGNDRRGFLSSQAIEDYLGKPQQVEGILAAIFGRDSPECHRIDAQYVREYYPRSLAILLCLNQGPMILQFIQYRELRDTQLPHRTKPSRFPSLPTAFWNDFFQEQWRFCAAQLERGFDHHIDATEILPITAKEEIGRGGHGIIYKIEIEESYNKLDIGNKSAVGLRLQNRNTLVLKTFRGSQAKQQYEAEREAFSNLCRAGVSSNFIIACYGSFIYGDTYNLVLEYADRGNLEDFWKTTGKPESFEDKLKFWDGMTNLSHGLATIHGTRDTALHGMHLLLGSHQDIRPANILVFSNGGIGRYDCVFKLADLGLCNFKQTGEQQPVDEDFDAHGTRAYGAPETYRSDDGMKSFSLKVKQDVDTWSLGCILSEAAVWVRYGWRRILEYRRQRRSEIHGELDSDGEYMFHNGETVLRCVSGMHEIIGRNTDQMTKLLLNLTDDMLAAGERPHARLVFEKSKRIVNDAKEKFAYFAPGGHSDAEDLQPRDSYDSAAEPKTPPFVPPAEHAHRSTGSSSRKRPQIMVETDWTRPRSPYDDTSASPGFGVGASSRQRIGAGGLAQMQSPYYDHRPASWKLEDPRPHVPNKSFGHSTGPGHFHTEPHPASMNSRSSYHIDEQYGNDGSDSGQNLAKIISVSANTRLDQRHTLGQPPARQPRFSALRSSIGSLANRAAQRPGSTQVVPSDPDTAEFQEKVEVQPVNHWQTLVPKGKQAETGPSHPHLSLDDGLGWMAKKKGKFISANLALPGEENFAQLHLRDHIFLIDDSLTMQDHFHEVQKLMKLLGYMLKSHDPNGLDINFTSSTSSINSKRSSKILQSIHKETFKGTSNMAASLERVLAGHKAKFGRPVIEAKPIFGRAPQPTQQRPLSVYVLTDGRWQPKCDVAAVIASLVKNVQLHDLGKSHIGVQFIRFGNDTDGKAKLLHLDRSLELPLDIVDSTYWNGNIWKILLGAINDWYDDDPDR